ncbi:hypothetical protein [Anaerovorax odorimutans]|nr:hypothetical protein [Anaerovorax odorimutans]
MSFVEIIEDEELGILELWMLSEESIEDWNNRKSFEIDSKKD